MVSAPCQSLVADKENEYSLSLVRYYQLKQVARLRQSILDIIFSRENIIGLQAK
jgi:hypothetical protein